MQGVWVCGEGCASACVCLCVCGGGCGGGGGGNLDGIGGPSPHMQTQG